MTTHGTSPLVATMVFATFMVVPMAVVTFHHLANVLWEDKSSASAGHEDESNQSEHAATLSEFALPFLKSGFLRCESVYEEISVFVFFSRFVGFHIVNELRAVTLRFLGLGRSLHILVDQTRVSQLMYVILTFVSHIL